MKSAIYFVLLNFLYKLKSKIKKPANNFRQNQKTSESFQVKIPILLDIYIVVYALFILSYMRYCCICCCILYMLYCCMCVIVKLIPAQFLSFVICFHKIDGVNIFCCSAYVIDLFRWRVSINASNRQTRNLTSQLLAIQQFLWI